MAELSRSILTILTLWLRLYVEIFVWILRIGQFIVNLSVLAITLLFGALSGSVGFFGGVAGPAFSLYFLLVEVAAQGIWFCIRLFGGLSVALISFVFGIDIAALARSFVRIIGYVFLAYMLIGTFVAPFTWIKAQSDVQIGFDEINCAAKPVLIPFFDVWTTVVDFLEPILLTLNVFLKLIFDFLDPIFDGLISLIFRGFELLVLTFTQNPAAGCSTEDFFLPYCSSSECVIKRWFCYLGDWIQFLVVDVFGGFLCLFLPDSIKNVVLNIIMMLISYPGLLIDMVAAARGKGRPCAGGLSLSSAQAAFDCYSNRQNCVIERNVCLVVFWFLALFESAATFLDYIIDILDEIGMRLFGFKFGTIFRAFIDIMEFIVNFFKNLFKEITKIVKMFVKPLIDAINIVLVPLKLLVEKTIKPILDKLKLAFDIVESIVKRIEPLVDGLVTTVATLKGIVDGLSGGIGGGGGGITGSGWPLRITSRNYIEAHPGYNSERMQRAVRYLQDKYLVDRVNAENILMLVDVYNKSIHLGCGLCTRCEKLLMETDMVDSLGVGANLSMPLNFTDTFIENNPYWGCAVRYVFGRRYHLDHMSEVTTPGFQMNAMRTLLPEDDACKAVLEEEIMHKMMHTDFDADELLFSEGGEDISGIPLLLRLDPWWAEKYMPCRVFYEASFKDVYDNETGTYGVPKSFYTSSLSNGAIQAGAALGIRVFSLPTGTFAPHHLKHTTKTGGFLYNMASMLHHVYSVASEHVASRTDGEMVDGHAQAMRILHKKPDAAHARGPQSLYSDDFPSVPSSSAWFPRRRMPRTDAVEKRLHAFHWHKTFGTMIRGTLNNSLCFHHTLGHTEDCEAVERARINSEHGAEPGIMSSVRLVTSWFMPQWNVPVPHRDASKNTRPKWRAPSRTGAYNGKRRSSVTARFLLAVTDPRDFDFDDVLQLILDLIILIIVIVIRFFGVLLGILFPVIEEFANSIADELDEFDFTDLGDFLDLLERFVNFGLDYWPMLKETVNCDGPQYVDPDTNPLGEWKVGCLLILRLPTVLPRPPENFDEQVIEYGVPCLDTQHYCNEQFQGQIPCTKYEDCIKLGFTDGFDVLIYIIEKTDKSNTIMPFLRGDTFGTIVTTVLQVAIIPLSPVLFLLGQQDVVTEILSFSTLEEIPFVGDIVFRFDNNGLGLEESSFHDFCVIWHAPTLLLPLIVVIFLLTQALLYVIQLPRALLPIFASLFSLCYCPVGLISDMNTELYKADLLDPQNVEVFWDDPQLKKERERAFEQQRERIGVNQNATLNENDDADVSRYGDYGDYEDYGGRYKKYEPPPLYQAGAVDSGDEGIDGGGRGGGVNIGNIGSNMVHRDATSAANTMRTDVRMRPRPHASASGLYTHTSSQARTQAQTRTRTRTRTRIGAGAGAGVGTGTGTRAHVHMHKH